MSWASWSVSAIFALGVFVKGIRQQLRHPPHRWAWFFPATLNTGFLKERRSRHSQIGSWAFVQSFLEQTDCKLPFDSFEDNFTECCPLLSRIPS